MFPRWELDLGGTSSCVQYSVLSTLGNRSSTCKGADHCSKMSSVGLDTEGKAALDFCAQWTCETEADALSSVTAKLQEQVKVILHLRQCRVGNVSTKCPLPPAFIWSLLCTKDIQSSQRHPVAQHSPATVNVQRAAKHLFLWRRSCHKSQFSACVMRRF